MQEAFTISLANLARDNALRAGARGELRWMCERFGSVTVEFEVREEPGGLQLELRYFLGAKRFHPSIPLVRGDGADELWMACPREGCGRRVAKLYLPVGREEFGCQACHGIVHGWVAPQDRFEKLL